MHRGTAPRSRGEHAGPAPEDVPQHAYRSSLVLVLCAWEHHGLRPPMRAAASYVFPNLATEGKELPIKGSRSKHLIAVIKWGMLLEGILSAYLGD